MSDESAHQVISRILVAFDHRHLGQQALNHAAALAKQADAEIVVMFVEDQNLLRLAGLPFAHEVNRTTGRTSRLDSDLLSQQTSRLIERLHRQVRESASQHQIRASLKVVQGQLVEQALTQSLESDLVFIGVADRHRDIRPFRAAGSAGTLIAKPTLPSKTIGVLHDGSAGANRTLVLAERMARASGMGITVILAIDPPEAAHALQRQVTPLLDTGAALVRFATLRPDDPGRLAAVLRAHRCNFVLISADTTLLPGVAGRPLVDIFECPLVLVR